MFKRHKTEKAEFLSPFKDPTCEISRWIEDVTGFDRDVKWSELFDLTRREYLMIERVNKNEWNPVLSCLGKVEDYLVTCAKLDTGTMEVCTERVSDSSIFRLGFEGSLGTLYTQNRHVIILKIRAIRRFEEKTPFQGKMAKWLYEEREKRRHISRPAPTRQERFSLHINSLLTSAVGEYAAEEPCNVLRTRIFEQNTDRKHTLSSAFVTRLEKPQARFAAQTVSFVVKYNRDKPFDVCTMGLFWFENGKCLPFEETGTNPGLGFKDQGTHYSVEIPRGLLEKADIIALVGPFNQA